MTTSPALACEHINAGYRDNVILHDLSLSIERGEMVAIIGPNGAGKTTLMRTITGRVRPSAGLVSIFGQPLSALTARERASRIGVVPQSVEVPMAFTVEEIVTMGRTPRLSPWLGLHAEDRKAVERAMAFTDVTDMRNQVFTELSGGEKQRVIIAMVLAQDPEIILLDEATSHLDINHRIEIMQIVERMNQEHGVTVAMISHDLNLAAEFCSRLILLDHGSIVADGTPRQVLTRGALQRVYHCDVCVQEHAATGSVTVTPAPRVVQQDSGRGFHVHVIGGGGAGEAIMRRLTIAQYKVTCGVVNQGDSDTETALALDIPTVAETPFSPVSDARRDEAIRMAAPADAVVIAGMPFGTGNVPNLDIAEAALRAGNSVLIETGASERDYTPDKTASQRVSRLLESGAVEFETVTELFAKLPAALRSVPVLKDQFPGRLGTSSYIVPAGMRANVQALSPYVDDIELLIFESDAVSNLPTPERVAELGALAAEHALSYTVHLPMDLRLGASDEAERQRSVEKCMRVIERMAPAKPFAYVLHLAIGDYPGPTTLSDDDLEVWRQKTDQSVSEIIARGVTPDMLCVETLAYPFLYADPVIESHDLRVCIDVGHLILGGEDVEAHIEKYWDRTRVFHMHGVLNGKDHANLGQLDRGIMNSVLRRMNADAGTPRVFTIEVFSTPDFKQSINTLSEVLS